MATSEMHRFIFWYRSKLSSNPILIIIGSLLSLLAILGAAAQGVSYLTAAITYLASIFAPHEQTYETLEGIQTDITNEYIADRVGPPVLRRNVSQEIDPRFYYERRIYRGEAYYLLTISGQEGNVLYYAVQSRLDSFRPEFPWLGFNDRFETRLLSFRPSEYFEFPGMENTFCNCSAKFCEYNESYYLGNPGAYRTIVFFHSASTEVTVNGDFMYALVECSNQYPVREEALAKKIHKMFLPNAYGLISNYARDHLRSYVTGSQGVPMYDERNTISD